jgi:hypothetical protein
MKPGIFHDREVQTLTVWFTDPSLEHVSEETGDEVVLMRGPLGPSDWLREAQLLGARIRFCRLQNVSTTPVESRGLAGTLADNEKLVNRRNSNPEYRSRAPSPT